MSKRIVVYSYYSSEELTGIGKYNGEMIEWLSKKGYEIVSISNAPFYPKWKIYKGFSNSIYRKRITDKNIDIRTWVYVPASPSAIKKILSEFSYFITSSIAILLNIRTMSKANAFLIICPPFFLGFFPLLLAKLLGKTTIHHIQDLQVDAAKELNLIPQGFFSILEFFERIFLRSSDYVTTISEGMVRKLSIKRLHKDIILLPNWSDLEKIKRGNLSYWLHNQLGVENGKQLIVYSGNIGEKQGLEIIVESAKTLMNNQKLHFVILGEGLFKERLAGIIASHNLSNVTMAGLVSAERLNQMLNDSFIQLVIQKSSAADSFLPSKLTNIMAAGCSSIVTTETGTSLFEILSESKGALIVKPENSEELVNGIQYLLNNSEERENLRRNARTWAENNLSIDKCLNPLINILS